MTDVARTAAVLIVLLVVAAIGLSVPHSRGASPAPRPTLPISSDLPTWLDGDTWTFETHVVTRNGPNSTSAWTNQTFTVVQRMAFVRKQLNSNVEG